MEGLKCDQNSHCRYNIMFLQVSLSKLKFYPIIFLKIMKYYYITFILLIGIAYSTWSVCITISQYLWTRAQRVKLYTQEIIQVFYHHTFKYDSGRLFKSCFSYCVWFTDLKIIFMLFFNREISEKILLSLLISDLIVYQKNLLVR